ncbi:hypothetical protein CP02DC16_0719A, partial [Chlamydia psittaci 02DC16]
MASLSLIRELASPSGTSGSGSGPGSGGGSLITYSPAVIGRV